MFVLKISRYASVDNYPQTETSAAEAWLPQDSSSKEKSGVLTPDEHGFLKG